MKRRLATRALACIAALLLPLGAHAAGVETDRVIVRLRSLAPIHAKAVTARAETVARISTQGGELMSPVRVMGDGSQVMQLFRRLAPADIENLARRFRNDPDVLDIVPDRIFFPALTPTDPQYAAQWALGAAQGINAPAAWDVSTGSPNLIIGIVDTGKLPHNDLLGRWIGGFDFVSLASRENDALAGRDADASDPGDWVTSAENAAGALAGCPVTDSRWHGTAMAGVIAANASNGAGIAGINWNSRILPVRVVGKCGAYESDIADGIRWAVGLPVPGVPANPDTADLINVSLSAAGSCSGALQSAINEVLSTGAPIIVAAGNNTLAASGYSPGNCAGVIAVGAVDRNGGKPAYANFGNPIALSAPGGVGSLAAEAVLTTHNPGLTTPAVNNDFYAAVNGTSISAAQVTGIASLVLSVKPTLTPAQVKDILANSARAFPVNTTALGSQTDCTVALCGAGIANALASVNAAQQFGAATPAVAAGHNASLALASDGSVYSWGYNTSGQLGDGTTTPRAMPALVPGLSGIVRVAMGSMSSFAVRADGTLYAWGRNNSGQLGDGSGIDRSSPTPVLGDVLQVASSGTHTIALKRDGTLWGWGQNLDGQVGDGSTISRSAPVRAVPTLTGITQITTGSWHSAALRSDGTVWWWGSVPFPSARQLTPVQVPSLSSIVAISGTTALKSDGTVWQVLYSGVSQVAGVSGIVAIAGATALRGDGIVFAWGDNDYGQLGDGTRIDRATPVQVQRLTGVIGIAAGYEHRLALMADGRVVAWGSEADGALGNGVLAQSCFQCATSRVYPVGVLGAGGAGLLGLGVADSTQFATQTDVPVISLRVSNAITVPAVPSGTAVSISGGEYSIGCTASFVSTPGTIGAGATICVRQVSATQYGSTTLAILTIGALQKSFTVTTRAAVVVPEEFAFAVQAGVLSGAYAVSNTVTMAEIDVPVAISVAGGEYSIGCNGSFTPSAGNIGRGQTVCVRAGASFAADTLTTATLTIGGRSAVFDVISAGASLQLAARAVGGTTGASYALHGNGTLYAWGRGSSLPNDSNLYYVNYPIALTRVSGVRTLARSSIWSGAGTPSFAIRADGTLWAWGSNNYGELGDGTTTARRDPVRILGITGVVEVATDGRHTIALKSDGTVWGWGQNFTGQVGDGSTTMRASPVQLPGLTGVVAVRASYQYSLALKGDGTVWSWGNDFGNSHYVPTRIAAFANIRKIAAGQSHMLAIDNAGIAYSYGCNYYGEMGNGNYNLGSCVYSPQQLYGPNYNAYVDIVAGENHSLALTAGGTVDSFGRNHRGQLGLGSGYSMMTIPATIPGLANVTAIMATSDEAAAVASDGSVYTWGTYDGAFMGPFNQVDLFTPTRVLGVGGVGYLNLGSIVTTFAAQGNVAPGAVVTSNVIVLTPIPGGATITIAGGSYSIGCTSTFITTASMASDGAQVCVRLTAPSSPGANASATLFVNGNAYSTFSIATRAADTTPDPFAFPPKANVEPGAFAISERVSISGLEAQALLTVSGGEWASMSASGPWMTTSGNAVNTTPIWLRTTAATTPDTLKVMRLTVGGVTSTFHTMSRVAVGTAFPVAMGAGDQTAFALRSDGRLYAWGDGFDGQLGFNDFRWTDRLFPELNPYISGVRLLAAGVATTIVRRGADEIWAWGVNCGQFPGLSTNPKWPVPVQSIPDVTQLAAGRCHGAALKSDGTVWSWGANDAGQVGDATTQNRATARQGIATGLAHIAAGDDYTIAARLDGTVVAWGDIPGVGAYPYPQNIAGMAGVAKVAAGTTHFLALRSDGTVLAQGSNSDGQLGDGTNLYRVSPVPVQGLSQVTAVAAGERFSVALRSDGTVWAWGDNGVGAVGDGTGIDRFAPVQVLGLPAISGIAAGRASTYAWTADGRVYAWGDTYGGAIGNGTEGYSAVRRPVQVLGAKGNDFLSLQAIDTYPDPFAFVPTLGAAPGQLVISNAVTVSGLGAGIASPVAIAGGEYSVNGGAFIASGGTVVNGNTVAVRALASAGFATTTAATLSVGGAIARASTFHVRTRGDPSAARVVPQVATGDSHTYLLGADGAVFATGYNGNGQLGNGTTLGLSVLRSVSSLARVVSTASGGFHGLALRSDGSVAAWGWNAMGQLGHNSGNSSELNPVSVAGLGGVASIAAGKYHSVAAKIDGSVWAWGLNSDGQVGDGSSVGVRGAPVAVAGLAGVIAIAAGGRHNLALLANGTLMSWGANESGQLGDGSTAQRNSPVPVPGLAGVIAIAAGDAHSLAIRNDGTVVAWGFNAFGQVGDGSTTNRLAPVAVTALGNGVGLVAAGANHTLAVKAGGALFSWGNNANSQLGNGNNANQLTPVPVSSPAGVVAIAGGARHTAVIDRTRRLYLWGDNFFGQVGNRSGNYNPHSASLNVLRGDSLVSTGVGGGGSSVGIGSNSGSSVLLIDGLATSFDFGALSSGALASTVARFRNQAALDPIDSISIGVTGASFSLSSNSCPAVLDPDQECNFTIAFNPASASTYSGELVVTSSVVGSPERRSLVGTGVAPASPAIALGASGLDFPPQTVGTATTASFGITNSGTAGLSVNAVASTIADFSATHTCGNVAPGASCTLNVSFTPSQPGSRTGYLTIASNASGSPGAITVYGTGVATLAPSTYVLALAKGGTGAGNVTSSPAGIACGATCSAGFAAGTGVTLTAAPSAGSGFSGWSGACSGTGACSVAMDAARSVTATFMLNQRRASDFNNDGRSDVLYRNSVTGQVYRILVDGFTFSNGAMAYTESNTAWKIVADADFNGDGVADLLWRNATTGQVYLMPIGANGLPNGGTIFYTEPNAAWKIVHTPDLDGDNKADLLWWNSSTGQVYAMLMNGSAIAAQGMVYQEPNTAWKIVAVGDFAGSGRKNQLLWRNATTGQVFLMTVTVAGGAFSWTGQMIYQEPDTAWKIIAAADFNGDGKSDILWRNEATGEIYMMLMNGVAIAARASVYRESDLAWKVVAQGDYNGDGKADLLWRSEATGQLYLMLMDGTTIAARGVVFSEPNTAWKVLGPWEYAQ